MAENTISQWPSNAGINLILIYQVVCYTFHKRRKFQLIWTIGSKDIRYLKIGNVKSVKIYKIANILRTNFPNKLKFSTFMDNITDNLRSRPIFLIKE